MSRTEEKIPLRFVFVSLDPHSDTPEQLRSFLNRFHPSFIGLIGEKSTVEALGKQCNIYHWQDPNSQATLKIDHSATLLLIDPNGQLKALFSPPYQKEILAQDLQTLLES